MRNLVTMGGQHQGRIGFSKCQNDSLMIGLGVFGVPNCPGVSSEQCEALRESLTTEGEYTCACICMCVCIVVCIFVSLFLFVCLCL